MRRRLPPVARTRRGAWIGAVLALLISALVPPPARGLPAGEALAGPDFRRGVDGATPGFQQPDLEEAVLRFARAWVDRDRRGLGSTLSTHGIRLHLQGALYSSVGVERAVGAVASFLERYPGGEAELMRLSQSSGTGSAGYADLQWRTTVAGTGEVVIFTLFVAMAREGEGWSVTEIRVLP